MHAPPELLEREAALLRKADLVFTGGPSLYHAKKHRHPNVHCFPSSVDARHFAQANSAAKEAAAQASLPRPRLGFFGVIDERFDINLLDYLSQARPEWQFSMVGPVVKIDPKTLPRRQNVHYFGQQSYAELPSFIAGWDVCLLPFAINDATRFISPTKTLEYMAAERMIVSTPIADVAEPYGDIVLLGDNPQAFLASCESALSMGAMERATRVEKMRGVLNNTSWDTTAKQMSALIEQIVSEKKTSPQRNGTTRFSVATRNGASRPGSRRVRLGIWGNEAGGHYRRRTDGAQRGLSPWQRCRPAGTERQGRGVVPLDAVARFHFRLCRAHHVFQ